MSSSFNVIRKHSRDATSVRIKELAEQLAKVRGAQNVNRLETEDIRSQGRMVHSTVKLNDERLKFVTTLSNTGTSAFYQFPTEPDLNFLKVWFMLDHLGTRIRDQSGFGNNAIVNGHPTLRRVPLNLGFLQTSNSFGFPAMLFNSGTDVVSQTNGEYIWVPDHPNIQFTNPAHSAGFSLCLRFNCLDFGIHEILGGGTATRRIAAKTDSNLTGHDVTAATDGWNLVANSAADGSNRGIVFQVIHAGVPYQIRATGFNTDTWYQLICTYDTSQVGINRVKMYVGGNLTGSVNSTTLFLPLHPNLRIGARDSTSGFFRGYIQDFRIYFNKVLTQTEVNNLNDNEITIDDIPKGYSFILQYAQVLQAQKTSRHRYSIGGRVIKTRTHKYNIINKLTKTKTHKYNILTKVPTRSKTHKYNILGKVTRSKTHKYNMGGVLRIPKTHKYNIIEKIRRDKTHKYNIGGGMQTQYKRFQKSTTAGSNITQQVTFDSTPQAIIVWSDQAAVDNTFIDTWAFNYGFSDGTNHACITSLVRDNISTTDTFSGHKSDKVISFSNGTTLGTVIAEATVSFGSNAATFNWTTNDTGNQYIHCLALWGMDRVEVKTFTAGQTSIGSKVYSFNDTNLTPKCLLTINRSGPVSWLTSVGSAPSVGAGVINSGTIEQFSVNNVSEDAKISSDAKSSYTSGSGIISGYDDDTGALENRANLTAMSLGSFTLDWTNAPEDSTNAFSVLAIQTQYADIVTITEPATTGNQVIPHIANVTKGVMAFGNHQATNSTFDLAAITVGAGSGTGATDQGLIVTRELDASSPTVTARLNKTGSIWKSITPAATAASSTTTTEASLNSIGTNTMTWNWSAVTGSSRIVFAIIFGGV